MACNTFLRPSKYLSSSYKLARKNLPCAFHLIIKEEPNQRPYQYVTSCQYSTVLRSKQSLFRSHNLYTVSKCLTSASFLSTHDVDKYHVVVTNPSATAAANTTDFSPGISGITNVAKSDPLSSNTAIGSVTDVSGVSGATDLTDIAVTLTNEMQTVAELVEPSLASLGLCNWTPVGLVQMLLEYLHISWHMPWWAAIAASTVAARILLFPILVKTQRSAIKMSNKMPQLQYLQAKFSEARRTGNTMEASRYAQEIMDFMSMNDISPMKNAMLPLLQAPVFISFFLGLRKMAKVPVESMQNGGIFWVTDLTIPDPYYVLPVVACGTLYIVLKIGAESGLRLENMKTARYVMQALPVVALPFCINFPSAVLFYWVTTNFCTLAFVSFLKIQPIRKALNLPTRQPPNPDYVMPKKGFVKGIKEAYEDQKALATIDERRRMDEVRFQKAGTGPVPRTYSYDPTKPRPSNAAASARQPSHAVSAKQQKT